MDIYYVNSKGSRIDFSDWPIAVEDVTQLFGRDWDSREKANKQRNRTRVSYFYRTSYQKKLDIMIFADSENEYKELMNSLNEITDIDIINNQPGKLYVGDSYLECYIRDTAPGKYEELFYEIENTLTIFAPYPFWINESTFEFEKIGQTGASSEYLNFPYNFPYNFTPALIGFGTIRNSLRVPCDFQMIIFGPAVSPSVLVDSHTYAVDTTIMDNEYLTIDSRYNTVVKTERDGTKTNEYDKRGKAESVFEKIQAGESTVVWNGSFGIQITLFEGRSEPKW